MRKVKMKDIKKGDIVINTTINESLDEIKDSNRGIYKVIKIENHEGSLAMRCKRLQGGVSKITYDWLDFNQILNVGSHKDTLQHELVIDQEELDLINLSK